jgi:type IV pilus assembly protein PilY1
MKQHTHGSFRLLAALSAMIAIAPAQALDTDVYLKSQLVGNSGDPNVLIILDNSGSMNSTVSVTRPAYNPSVNYCTDDLDTVLGMAGSNAGKPGSCGSNATRTYYSFTGSPPSYSSSQYFTSSENYCLNSASALATSGKFAATKIAAWKSSSNWRSLNGLTDSGITYVDCQSDGTTNGQATGDNKYPRNSTSTAYATSGTAFNWGSFSTNPYPTLFSANYMNYWHNTNLDTSRSRMNIAKDAVIELINANKDVRFGLMLFNTNTDSDGTASGNHGGRVVFKVDTMTDARRASMTSLVNGIVAGTWTPLAETMWEAYSYLSGSAVDYGNNEASATPARDTTAESGTNYISPLQYSCQKAYVIYVTDGDPTIDTNANAKIKTKTGVSNCDANSATANSCLDSLAGWMHDNDVVTSLPTKQTVTTYTIGFGGGISAQGLALLQATATKGGGAYTAADDADQLNTALQGYLLSILSETTTFNAPSLAINAFNKQYNNDDVYLSVFLPGSSCGWPGNVKKYKLCTQADITANRCDDLSDVLDQNGVLITDLNNNIVDTARSYWSSSTDGSTVDKGGAGGVVPAPSSRNIYTYYGSYSGLTVPSTGVKIEVSGSNTFYNGVKADPTLLGLASTATTAEVDDLVNWIRGQDSYDKNINGSTTDARWAFGDPLHSRSVPINYGGTSSNPIIKLFVGTNDGVLRMINNTTGVEEWAFMPQEMYSMQYKLSQDADGDHYFGVDNTPGFWVRDINNDGIIDPVAGDRVYMYVTFRRGGRDVFGFDVTPGSTLTSTSATFTPKLMWVIKGGTGDFVNLGQTWAVPQIARVRYACSGTVCDDGNPTTNDSSSRVVLMFAGGYDPHQDTAVPAGPDSMGNAIYMVNPLTGARIWWAGLTGSGATLQLAQMKYSIPSDLTLVDTDGDGTRDRLYVGDTGGQIWRIDLAKNLAQDSNGTGTAGYVFADIGCSSGSRTNDCAATAAQHRRKFLYPPAVAPVRDTTYSSSPNYDLLAIGSGDREDPLDLLTTGLISPQSKEAVHNRIYVFRDYDYGTGTPAVIPSALSETNLYDASADLITTSTGAALQTEIDKLKVSKGWYMDLHAPAAVTVPNGLSTQWVGEKVLARATVFDGILYMTTFTPANQSNSTLTCDANSGVATEYVIDAISSKSALTLNGNATRSTVVGGGIPSEVVIIFRPDGTSGVISGGGKGGAPVAAQGIPNNSAQRQYWHED